MSDPESKYMGIPLTAVIDRFEEDRAVLRFQDGQELTIPKDRLTGSMNESSSVRVYVMDDAIDQKRREDLAKSILNELLVDAA